VVDGNLPLFYARQYSASYEILRLLITSGADLTKRNRQGMTALHILIENKAPVKDIKFLLEHGIDVNAQSDRDGKMPLHMAAKSEQLEVV